MGGSKGGSQIIGYRYYMAIQMGIARGPIDEIVQIDVGDVRAWPLPDGDANSVSGLMTIAEGPNGLGVAQYEDGTYETLDGSTINTIRATGEYNVAAENLFGGDKKEGGVAGSLRAFMGSSGQVIPAYIKNLMGGRVPDFRGVVTLWFDGLVTSINPYPKKWEFRVRRTNSGWDGDVWQPSLAAIWMRGGTIKGMNGAHILYETLTNRDWGRGLSRDWIEETSWLKAAQTLYNEGLGLCLRYSRQSELSGFIQEVVDHIGGSIYPDRTTGRLVLTLLRDDYDADDLPLFTYDTGLIALNDVETSGQDDLVNEVVVKWSDPITKTERSARVQNLALSQSMGASNSTTTSYAGIPEVDLALRMCQRDLEAGSNALKRFTVVLDRRAWRLSPGMPFRISVPDRNIFNAVLRAGKVTESGDGDGRITVQAALDTFGLPSSSFISAQVGEWMPPSREALIADKLVVREANYAELVRAIDPANLNILSPSTGIIGTVVGKPSALSQGYDLRITPEGADEANIGGGTFSPYIVSDEAIGADMGPTTFSFEASSDFGIVTAGMVTQFGDEIGRITAIDTELSTVTILRGCYDTIPVPHPAGTTLFFVSDEVGSDGREYASGESVDVQILPFTSTSKLPQSIAPVISLDIVGRQGRPYPPARMMVNGDHFSDLPEQNGDLVLSWAHRDRIVQQDQLIGHEEASVGPEAGTTYTVRVYDDTTLLRTVTGVTGTGWTYTTAMRATDGIDLQVTFEIESVRDGFTSFNKYRFVVEYEPSGYGVSGYGDAYGN